MTTSLRAPWTVAGFTLLAICGLTRGGVAQESPVVGVGSRVRLTLEGAQPPTLIGQLVEFGPESLTIAGKKARDRRVLLRSGVRQVEVSLRQEYRIVRGMALGALAGALIGGAGALVVAGATTPCSDPSTSLGWCSSITAGRVLTLMGLLAATGAGEGYSLASKHPRDVWSPARLPDGLAPARPAAKPMPLFGLGAIRGHRVLLIGLSFAR